MIYGETATANVKPGTIRVKKHEIDKLLPYLANLKLDITLKNYKEALNDSKERAYADSTLFGVYRTGRIIFRIGIEMSLTSKAPTEFAYVKETKKLLNN